MGKDSGLIYRSFVEATRLLDPETRLEAIDAYCNYLFEGEEYTGGNAIVKALLLMAIPTLDKAQSRYEAACENGKKGGRPRKEKPEENQTETREKPENNQSFKNENLNDAVAVDDTDAVTDDVDVYEDIQNAPAGARVLSDDMSYKIKRAVVEEGNLTELAEGTWILPAQIAQIDKDIYVIGRPKQAAEHIRDRYGGFFANAIRAVIPDAQQVKFVTI